MAYQVIAGQNETKIVLSGDIDLQVSGDIKTEIERLADISRLEIDASEVTYIDSSGVAVLILARQHCTRNNITLALPSISEAVHRVLQIAKLDVMLPIGEIVARRNLGTSASAMAMTRLAAGISGMTMISSTPCLPIVTAAQTMPDLAIWVQPIRLRATLPRMKAMPVTAVISRVSTSMRSISPNPSRKRRRMTASRTRSRFWTATR